MLTHATTHRLAFLLCFTTAACAADDVMDDESAGGSSGEASTTAMSGSSTTDASTSAETSSSSTTTTTTTDASTTADPTEGGSTGSAAQCETDICATYGAAVPDVSAGITAAAAADPMFMDDFAPLVAAGDEAVQAFIDSLANFITDAYGCTEGAYTGPTMEAAHTGLDITQEEYDAFIVLTAGVLADAGVPEDDINLCFAPPLVDPAFASTIIGQ